MTNFTVILAILAITTACFSLLALGTFFSERIMPALEMKVAKDKREGKVSSWAKMFAVAHVLLEEDYDTQVARYDD